MHFKVIKPTNIENACELLSNPAYMPLAGGTDLIVKLKGGLLKNIEALVDISGLKLNEITEKGEAVIIGSGCTMSDIASSELIKQRFAALAKAASMVGAPQIRNTATIGGNISNASPAGDTIPALMSLNAVVVLKGAKSEREIPLCEYFVGPGKTKKEQSEIITGFKIASTPTKGTFLKLGARASHAISKINIAVSLVHNNGKNDFRIAAGSVAPVVVRCAEAERLLNSAAELNEAVIASAAQKAEEAVKPISDIRSSGAYRKKMTGVLLKRAIMAVIAK